jgi:hypothetical protein
MPLGRRSQNGPNSPSFCLIYVSDSFLVTRKLLGVVFVDQYYRQIHLLARKVHDNRSHLIIRLIGSTWIEDKTMRKYLIAPLFLFALLCATNASADVIWLSRRGMVDLKSRKGPHFGVIRRLVKLSPTQIAFEWQPYQRNWTKPAQLTVIQAHHIEKISHSLDTLSDMAHMVRSVRESLLIDPKMKAQIQGKDLILYPKLNSTLIVQSVLENMTRKEAFTAEPDPDVTNKGVGNLRVLLKLWANPESYGKASVQAMAKEYRAMGVEARRALLGTIANAQRLMDTRPTTQFNLMDLDPVSLGTHALSFVAELSWKLKTAEKKRVGQDEEMAKLLLDVLSSNYQTYTGQRFFRAAEKQLKQLVQNSARAQKYVLDEFTRSSGENRKGAAALILTKCAKNDQNGGAKVQIVQSAARYVLKLVRGQPQKPPTVDQSGVQKPRRKSARLSHSRRLLSYIMAHHPAAYAEVQRCINELHKPDTTSGSVKGAQRKTLLEDKLFLESLEKCKKAADLYKQKLQRGQN